MYDDIGANICAANRSLTCSAFIGYTSHGLLDLPVEKMQTNEVVKTFRELLLSLSVTAASLCFFTLSQLIVRVMGWQNMHSVVNFAIEYMLIIVPMVLIVSVPSGLAKVICAITIVCLLLLAWRRNCLELARLRTYEMGPRLPALTVVRSLTYVLTVICILAVDFASFPMQFMKSRKYGAALMDTGIGFFVFSMGSVSHRLQTRNQLKRLGSAVSILLVLGALRTIILNLIHYHQDVHEYGVHLNAFFTLGLTKLFASLLSALACDDKYLLPMGLSVLVVHETVLQLGVADYVMDEDGVRNNLLNANREGICSLPGFVAIYLLSLCLSRWLRSQDFLTYEQFIARTRMIAVVVSSLWLVMFACTWTIGIARVTCNTGYIVFMIAMIGTSVLYYMLVTELMVNTLWPVLCTPTGYGGVECKAVVERPQQLQSPLMEAINQNGLLYFLVANVLTGGVNIYLEPWNCTGLKGVGILCAYTLLATGFVSALYHRSVRIA